MTKRPIDRFHACATRHAASSNGVTLPHSFAATIERPRLARRSENRAPLPAGVAPVHRVASVGML
jgi:hypothetical protein